MGPWAALAVDVFMLSLGNPSATGAFSAATGQPPACVLLALRHDTAMQLAAVVEAAVLKLMQSSIRIAMHRNTSFQERVWTYLC